MPQTLTHDVGVVQVEVSIDISAPREIVWKALLKHTSEWWRPEFCVSPAPRGVFIEPWVGGRWYEDAGKGAGGLWGVIQTLLPPATLEVRGDLFPNWGGPATMHLRIVLEEVDARHTRLKVIDTCFGRVTAKLGQRLEAGWTLLFGEGLRPFAEKLAAPKRRGKGKPTPPARTKRARPARRV